MSRGHVELVHAPELPAAKFFPGGWPDGVGVRVLSEDPLTGAMSGVLEVPAGWRRPAGHLLAESEWIVIEGSLRVGERMRGFGYYEFAPAGALMPSWSTESGCRVMFFARDRRPAFVPAPRSAQAPNGTERRIELDTEAMLWIVSPVPGPPEGILLKLLRHVESTGEMTFLCSTVPQYDYPALEFHDCVEEVYMIEGDIWLGNSGLMTRGSYFWRPPFITHGPFYSRTGSLMLGWVPSTLVNHVPVNASSTPDENLQRFIAAGGQRVMNGAPAAAAAAG